MPRSVHMGNAPFDPYYLVFSMTCECVFDERRGVALLAMVS